MKVLVCDPASSDALKFLNSNGIEVYFKPEINAADLLSEVVSVDALMIRSRTKITREVIERGKNLNVIARVGSGFDNIDISACREKGIAVINAPDANSQSVAELTVCLIISLLRKTTAAFFSMKNGKWLKNEIWGFELFGRTVGILGYGFVGKKVADLLKAFNCELLIYSLEFSNCTLTELFSKSDIITIHVSLTDKTKGLVNRKLLAKMKKTAYLINSSRGGVIVEDDLYHVLSLGKIAGAALDVFWQEPLAENSRWRKLENVILSPHLGAATADALDRASMTIADDLVRIKNNKKPKFQVL